MPTVHGAASWHCCAAHYPTTCWLRSGRVLARGQRTIFPAGKAYHPGYGPNKGHSEPSTAQCQDKKPSDDESAQMSTTPASLISSYKMHCKVASPCVHQLGPRGSEPTGHYTHTLIQCLQHRWRNKPALHCTSQLPGCTASAQSTQVTSRTVPYVACLILAPCYRSSTAQARA